MNFIRLFSIAALLAWGAPSDARSSEGWGFSDVLAWVEEHRDAEAHFSPGEVLSPSDVGWLQPFVPPGFWTEFDFPEIVADARSEPVAFFGPNSRVPRSRWQLRPCYVVEQRPRASDHPYARKLLFIDAETYNIPYALNFDRQDRLWRVIYEMYEWPHEGPAPSDAAPSDTVPRWRAGVSLNVQNGNSTHFWSNDTVIPDPKIAALKRRFNVSNLSGGR